MSELNLKELRKQKRMTQEEVAFHLKIARATYSRYESGEYEMSYKTLIMLAELFSVSIDYLLGRYDRNPVFLSDAETAMIKKYRSLDDRGKQTVQSLINYEYSSKQ